MEDSQSSRRTIPSPWLPSPISALCYNLLPGSLLSSTLNLTEIQFKLRATRQTVPGYRQGISTKEFGHKLRLWENSARYGVIKQLEERLQSLYLDSMVDTLPHAWNYMDDDIIDLDKIKTHVGEERARPRWSLPEYQWEKLSLKEEELNAFRIIELLPAPQVARGERLHCRLHIVCWREKSLEGRKLQWLRSPPGCDPHMMPQHFDALSYCCGNQEKDRFIICDYAWIPITENLSDALNRLVETDLESAFGSVPGASPAKPLFIWVDAICINQGDGKERASQVLLMREIFGNARKTIVWLGDDEYLERGSNSVPLLDQIARIQANFEQKNQPGRVGGQQRTIEWLKELYGSYGSQLGLHVSALKRLLERPWFTRAWIMQEFALSKHLEIHYGPDILDWKKLATAAKICPELAMPPYCITRETASLPDVLNEFKATVQQSLHANQPVHLLDLLSRLRHCDATDDKDLIYSLLGLVKDFSPDRHGLLDRYEIRPSYEPGPTIPELFLRTACYIMETSCSLELLMVPSQSFKARARTGLPTWVPDWRYNERTKSLMKQAKELEFNASARSVPWFRISGDRQRLTLRGIFLEVASVSQLWPDQDYVSVSIATPEENMTRLSLIESCDQFVLGGQIKRYPNGEDLKDVYCQTILAGDGNLNRKKRLERFKSERKTLKYSSRRWRTLQQGPPLKVDKGDLVDILGSLPKSIRPYTDMLRYQIESGKTPLSKPSFTSILRIPQDISNLEHVRRLITQEWDHYGQNRRFAWTKAGLLGLVPNFSLADDILFIPEGGRAPLVLRSTIDKGSYFLIGAAYVHGLMYGEAWTAENLKRKQEIVLV